MKDICCLLSETSFSIPTKVSNVHAKRKTNVYSEYCIIVLYFTFRYFSLQSKLASVAAIFVADVVGGMKHFKYKGRLPKAGDLIKERGFRSLLLFLVKLSKLSGKCMSRKTKQMFNFLVDLSPLHQGLFLLLSRYF